MPRSCTSYFPYLLELASPILPAPIELTSPLCAAMLPVPPPTSAIDPWHLKSLWIILARRLTFRGMSPMKYVKNKERDRKKCYLKPRLNSISRGFPIKKNWNMFIGSKICSLLHYTAEDLKWMHSFLCFAFHFLCVFLFSQQYFLPPPSQYEVSVSLWLYLNTLG